VIHRPSPPRFVVRTTIAMFVVVAFVLSAVLLVVGLNVRTYVQGTVSEKLRAGQQMLSSLEQRRAHELQGVVATLAENSTLKAAIDTYRVERAGADSAARRELLLTIEREIQKLAARIRPDVLAVSDTAGTVLAVAGRRKADWPETRPLRRSDEPFLTSHDGVFRVASAPISIHDEQLGALELATALDGDYARELSVLSRTSTVIVAGDRIVASTLPATAASDLQAAVLGDLGASSEVSLAGSRYAIQPLFRAGDAAVFALDSIDAAAGPAMTDAIRAILLIALGAFGLAAGASAWTARTLARPIDTLSRSLSDMTRSRSFDERVPLSGSTREVDTLTDTFNTMMESVAAAEAETRSAYVGTIRALALALDARDPYTAGHSERVSAISVAIGREMGVAGDELEVLRLGALLHDIGKIGVSDHILRKPASLTEDEYAVIKEHPALGARILRSVPFLAPHLPIVELHHERPDGKGYPHGLHSDETPLLPRIVHVADAFDAMTSARAYRPGRASADALRELWRCAGTQFDVDIVQALARALPMTEITASAPAEPHSEAAVQGPRRFAIAGRI
jgi:putative nucleotidyltransferase with HDIG domain